MIFSCILVVFVASLATGIALPAGTKTSELSNVQPSGYISGGGRCYFPFKYPSAIMIVSLT